MRETRTFTIKGCAYSVTQLGAYKSLTLLHILSRVTAPAFKEVVVTDDDAASQEMGERLGGILERLSEKDMRTVVDTLAGATKVTLSPEQGSVQLNLSDLFDDHFSGSRLSDMLQWLIESLKLNFSDFLAGMSALLQGAADSKEAEPNSPTD